MKKKKSILGILTVIPLALLVGCSPQDGENQGSVDETVQSSVSIIESSSDSQIVIESESMEDMQHGDDSGEIPVGLQEAENPKYEKGEKVILLTDHMPGMKDATATIVGAFDTIAYEVTFQPTNGEELEENHKWVIKEEIPEANSQESPLEPGTEVTLEAKHMAGMEGSTATIDSYKDTTVYMIDYEPTTGGETVQNHKWFTEEELSQK